jgi:squalene cyclase
LVRGKRTIAVPRVNCYEKFDRGIDDRVSKGRNSKVTSLSSPRSISRALRSAVEFLARAQGADGLWRDFPSFVGDSDEWVTAYVSNALLGTSFRTAENCVLGACDAMQKRQRPTGGWGYNEDSPPDADSTAWAFRVLVALGKARCKSVHQAKRFMARHQRRDGGIATYFSPWPLRRKFARPSSWSTYTGWCVTDPCVTAAAVNALDTDGQRNAVAFLLKQEGRHGEWRGYWWADYEYATTLALESVTTFGDATESASVERALTWIRNRVQPSGAVRSTTTGRYSPFATACALRALGARRTAERTEQAGRCIAWLIRNQRTDGAWRASATLRIPRPNDRNPEKFRGWTFGGGIGDICLDQNAVFTTASVVAGLKPWL